MIEFRSISTFNMVEKAINELTFNQVTTINSRGNTFTYTCTQTYPHTILLVTLGK